MDFSQDELIGLDEVIINSLELDIQIGCTQEEREKNQTIELNIKANIGQWQPLAQEGSMEKTVNYVELSESLQNLANKQQWFLIEEFVETAILELFTKFRAIQSLDIEARKFSLPKAKWAGVRFIRDRS